MTAFWTAVAAILIFCILIFVHELGHFISAKLLGIRVHEFAIGMGPKLWSRKKGETLYSVRALPIGGFCALEGEDTASADERALSNKPAWAKLIVMAAGSCMNLILGLLLLFCLFGTAKQVVVPEVSAVQSGGAAELAGIQPGDEILRLDGDTIHIISDLQWVRGQLGEEPVEVVVRSQNGEKRELSLTPQLQNGAPSLGIQLKVAENSLLLTAKNGFFTTIFYARVVLETLVDLLQGELAFSSMSGPVGIVSEIKNGVQQTVEQGSAGFLNLLQLAVLLTVNLGIFNLLPIPALDGGRIFFVLVEMIRRKPLPPEKEGLVHMIGFILLIVLSIIIAYMDVLKLLV
ncbi:MAG: site-2 protease family protein [Clostridia bacterium]|nr:site-2 protease family protein [Clostridia bacterium]